MPLAQAAGGIFTNLEAPEVAKEAPEATDVGTFPSLPVLPLADLSREIAVLQVGSENPQGERRGSNAQVLLPPPCATSTCTAPHEQFGSAVTSRDFLSQIAGSESAFKEFSNTTLEAHRGLENLQTQTQVLQQEVSTGNQTSSAVHAMRTLGLRHVSHTVRLCNNDKGNAGMGRQGMEGCREDSKDSPTSCRQVWSPKPAHIIEAKEQLENRKEYIQNSKIRQASVVESAVEQARTPAISHSTRYAEGSTLACQILDARPQEVWICDECRSRPLSLSLYCVCAVSMF